MPTEDSGLVGSNLGTRGGRGGRRGGRGGKDNKKKDDGEKLESQVD